MKGLCSSLIGSSCLALFVGCTLVGSSEPSRFYLLTPVDEVAEADAAAMAPLTPAPIAAAVQSDPAPCSVRIAAVELPQHLKSSEIATRVDGNRIQRAEYDRWAEPLSDNFATVLAENLSTLIPVERVGRFPWELPGRVDYHVMVAVLRFDTAEGRAMLEASWSVTTNDVRNVVATQRSDFSEPVAGDGYGAIVSAMSATVASLSREIAEAIREHD